jgi:transcriptional regulator with XRE-family HTH domain
MTVRNALTRWRVERQLSQEEVGDLIGVSAMTVSRWERGNHVPRRTLWPKITEQTGLRPSDLLNEPASGAAA